MSQSTVDNILRQFIQDKKQLSYGIHPSYGRLFDEIERVVFSGGKRLRPHLVFLGYGSYDETSARIAAAYELLHVALLVHDDIIDRDTIRHGQPTIHRAYQDHYNVDSLNDKDKKHFAESAAILAGDLLISMSYELVASAQLSPEMSQKVTAIFSTAVMEVAGGELLDTESAFITENHDPLLVYRYKTAGYSCIAPLVTGAMLSAKGYDASTLQHLTTYATNVGIAYQIHDDILGVFGDEALTGKTTVGDLREGKQTILISTLRSQLSDEHHHLLEQSFGNADAKDDELNALKDVIKDSGALAKTIELEQQYMTHALEALESIEDGDLRDRLNNVTELLVKRVA